MLRLLLLAAALLPTLAIAAPSSRLEARIGGIHGASGRLACALFHGPGGFPLDNSRAAARIYAPVGGLCAFAGLGPGEYAVAVFHDDDNSGKLEKTLLGAPKKGYGVSNNHTHALSAPTWEESRVELRAGEAKTIEIELRY